MNNMLFRRILSIILIICVVFSVTLLEEYGVFENYNDWNVVDVPTKTNTTSVIKIPKEWRFVIENELVYIKDSEGNVIAEQLCEGWIKGLNYESMFSEDSSEVIINPDYMNFYESYNSNKITSNNGATCNIVEYYSENGDTAYVMHIPVYKSEKGRYLLVMRICNEKYDFTTFKKMVKSVRYPKDFYQYEN